jgi:hypothetical protein
MTDEKLEGFDTRFKVSFRTEGTESIAQGVLTIPLI